MKIAIFTDKKGSAIDRLANMIKLRLPHHQIEVATFHPKRPGPDEIMNADRLVKWCDLIDFQYWKTAVTIRQMVPRANDKPCILNHHNEHNINGDWEWKSLEWNVHVCKNGWQKIELEKQGYKPIQINHACEFDNFSYAQPLTDEKVVGYVGQIKKNKGVREIWQACRELGYKFMLVGSVSQAGYWNEMQQKEAITTMYPGSLAVPDEHIGEAYHKMRVYCANSDDGTESGTMPILEAMASGIPVVTRKIGLVRDCGENQKNMIIREGKYTDIEDLKNALTLVMENDDVANEMRERAWRTVRQYHPEIQSRRYNLVYHRLMNQKPLVSVIMPTFNRKDILIENMMHLQGQSYDNFELVVCDDGSNDGTEIVIDEMRKRFPDYPIKYINTGHKGYGLAKARNMGIIEAAGDILVFCDDRLRMHNEAINNFVKFLTSDTNKKLWAYGSKGHYKAFVENFSAAWRDAIIKAGMFNERMDEYGGMTQEVTARYACQGFNFPFCPQALATPLKGTHSRSRHRQEIINSKIKLYKMGLA